MIMVSFKDRLCQNSRLKRKGKKGKKKKEKAKKGKRVQDSPL